MLSYSRDERRLAATVIFACLLLLVWQGTIATGAAEAAIVDLLAIPAGDQVVWAALTALVYGGGALAWMLGVLGMSAAEAGLSLGRLREHARWYAAALVVMLATTLPAALWPSFRSVYPLAPGGGPAWFLVYAGALFGTEAFFRGLLLFPLERALGRGACWVSVLPYVLTHAHKPPLEALGAAVAGLVLAELALASRSIWGGVLLHVAVAFTMELAAAR